MRKTYGYLAAALLASTAVAASAEPSLPELNHTPLLDPSNVLNPTQQQLLRKELTEINAVAGHQMAVAIVPNMGGYDAVTYGHALFGKWRLGDAQRKDGVLLLIAMKERKSRFDVGYGLEPVLTDAMSNRINQSVVVPAFKRGDYFGGIVGGVQSAGKIINAPDATAAPVALAASPAKPADKGSGALWWVLGGVGLLGGGAVAVGVVSARKRREEEEAEAVRQREAAAREAASQRDAARRREADRSRAERPEEPVSTYVPARPAAPVGRTPTSARGRVDTGSAAATAAALEARRAEEKRTQRAAERRRQEERDEEERRSSSSSSYGGYSGSSWSTPTPSPTPTPTPSSSDWGSSSSSSSSDSGSSSFDGGGGSSGGGGDTSSW